MSYRMFMSMRSLAKGIAQRSGNALDQRILPEGDGSPADQDYDALQTVRLNDSPGNWPALATYDTAAVDDRRTQRRCVPRMYALQGVLPK